MTVTIKIPFRTDWNPVRKGFSCTLGMSVWFALPEAPSLIRSVTGIILGAVSFRNEYDGHTIESSLEQVERLTGRKIKLLAGDRENQGLKQGHISQQQATNLLEISLSSRQD